jgi:hypothetical protein
MMCMDFRTRNASASAITIGKLAGGRTTQTGAVLQRLAGALLGGTILAAAGTSVVMAKDLKRAQAKDGDPKTAFAKLEHMKVCSLYGEGFYDIPGTGTCAKAGFWLRADGTVNGYPGDIPFIVGPGAAFANGGTTEPLGTIELRGGFSDDLRIPTSYAPVRIYVAANAGFDNFLNTRPNTGDISGVGTLSVERAFIQFAGFTFGKSQSYFDVVQVPNASYWTYPGASTTGTLGTLIAAYTATFGDGFSATISAEDSGSRRNALWDAGTNGLPIGSFPGPNAWAFNAQAFCVPGVMASSSPLSSSNEALNVECATGDYAAQSIPDIVSSLRVDQAWGSAQISGALHQVRGNFYGNNVAGAPARVRLNSRGFAPQTHGAGRPTPASCSICRGTPATSSGSRASTARALLAIPAFASNRSTASAATARMSQPAGHLTECLPTWWGPLRPGSMPAASS